MGRETDIAYADSTINPTSGCDGCELWNQLQADAGEKQICYAGPYHQNRLASGHPLLYSARFCDVKMIPGRMAKAASWTDLRGKPRPDKPWLNGLPRVIFVGDMGDVFSRAVTFEFLKEQIVDVTASANGRRHIWLMLTKKANRLVSFGAWLKLEGIAWPKNLWAGVTVTSRAYVWRVDQLRNTVGPAVKFVSFEPLLGLVDVDLSGIDWAMPGGASGVDAPECQIEWIREIVATCRNGATRVFVKQLGSNATKYTFVGDERRMNVRKWVGNDRYQIDLKHPKGGDPAEWPEDLRIRQMPEGW